MTRQTLILSCVLILCLMLGMLFIRQRDEAMRREALAAAQQQAKDEALKAKAQREFDEWQAREDAELKLKLDTIRTDAAIAKMRIEAQLGRR